MTRQAFALAALALGGCSLIFDPPVALDHAGDAATTQLDAAPSDAADLPYVPHNLAGVDLPAPNGPIDLCGEITLDTSAPGGGLELSAALVQQSQPEQPEVFVVVTEGFTLCESGTLAVVGDHPLVVLAIGDIQIDGEIAVVGAGSDPYDCIEAGDGGGDQSGGSHGGGGGGGGFGDVGGVGGIGGSGDTAGDGGSRGGAEAVGSLLHLRGGCSGGRGGNLDAAGGRGGGALELASASQIRITESATVYASGLGGAGSTSFPDLSGGGGGGGGSGGMIMLTSPEIELAGVLAVNGGSGGQGSSADAEGADGVAGSFSTNPATAEDVNQGAGGIGGSGGVSVRTGEEVNPYMTFGTEGAASSEASGGGGGGAAGLILIAPFVPSG